MTVIQVNPQSGVTVLAAKWREVNRVGMTEVTVKSRKDDCENRARRRKIGHIMRAPFHHMCNRYSDHLSSLLSSVPQIPSLICVFMRLFYACVCFMRLVHFICRTDDLLAMASSGAQPRQIFSMSPVLYEKAPSVPGCNGSAGVSP